MHFAHVSYLQMIDHFGGADKMISISTESKKEAMLAFSSIPSKLNPVKAFACLPAGRSPPSRDKLAKESPDDSGRVDPHGEPTPLPKQIKYKA
ncbi:MAG: hypothetical protein V1908_03140 [Candidatus Peregrinibacteria bacterium]